LHPFTQIVFYVSACACRSQWVLLGFFVGLIGLVAATFLSQKWKKNIFSLVVSLPGVRGILAKVAWVRFARAAASLLEGGLPLIDTLEQASTVIQHPHLRQVIQKTQERIFQGESLAASFSGHGWIPPLIPRMLGIAEQSGKLAFTMQQIAQIYEEELETSLLRFAALAQPLLLLSLGVLVGFVLLSVLLPLTDVSSFVN
jgi:general secretion pathway protein F